MPLTPEEEALIEIDSPIDAQISSELDYLGAPQGPVTSPSEVDPSFASVLDSIPSPTLTPEEEASIEIDPPSAQSVKVAGRGFGPDTGQGALWQKGQEQFAENDARIAANRDLDLQQSRGAYSQAGTALEAQSDVEAEMNRSLASILQEREGFLRDSAELDKTMYAEARAESEQYLAAYRQQMAAVRQMTVTNPVQSLGALSYGGVSLAMFAQGFLAAQGINIDVAGQVDRWVDRSIEEQRRQIGQAQAGAEDQLNLWRIAQETSRNDQESRMRYRGMVLEAMTTAVDINAARFAAPLARSAAEVAKAKLAMEQVGVERDIRHGYEQERLANMKAMRDEAHMRVMERFRGWELSIQDRAQKARADKEGKAPNLLIDSRNVKRDPSTGKVLSGGLVVGELSHDAPTETQKAVIGKKQLNDAVQSGSDELRKLYNELDGEFGPGWLRNRKSEAYTLFNAERNRVVGDIMRNFTGLAATDKEAQRWLDQLGDDKTLQLGPNRLPKLIDGMSAWARRGFEQSLDLPGVIKYAPEQRGYSQQLEVDPETSALVRARASGGERIPSTIEQISGPAATDTTRYVDREPSKFYASQKKPEVPSMSFGPAGQRQAVERSAGAVEAWSVQLDDLARAALDAKKFMSGKSSADPSKRYSEDPTEVQRQALMDLASIANGRPLAPGQPAPPKTRREYAQALMDMYDKDPNQLRQLLE